MAYNEKKKEYNRQYSKEHYKRIPLEVTKEQYEIIKAAADSHNEKVNTYIKNSIQMRLDSEPRILKIEFKDEEPQPPKTLTLKSQQVEANSGIAKIRNDDLQE